MPISTEDEVPGMTPAEKQQLREINEQIQSLNAEDDRLKSLQARLQETDAVQMTPADVAAAEGMRSAQVALRQREIEVRTRLDRWFSVKRRACHRAADKAAAARDAIIADVVKKMLSIGFVREVPLPNLGEISVPGIVDVQLARHPGIAQATVDAAALASQAAADDAAEGNRRELERISRTLGRVKSQALASL